MTKNLHEVIYHIHNNIKEGWTQYSLYFYMGSLSAILGGFSKLAGIIAFMFTIGFFYLMGRFHVRISNLNKSKEDSQNNQPSKTSV